MNPNQPNEGFQESEIRKYAESIYSATENLLVKAIVDTLGLEGDLDSEGNPIVMEFNYAYKKLLEAGYTLNHNFKENGGTCSLDIQIYKLDKTFTYDVKTTHSISIT